MSKKDYKKGMADAMSAYEAFGEKQEAAIRYVGAEIEKTAGKVDKLGGKIGEIADYITDKEKAELYKLNTPVDIADLEDAEKRILVAVLYQLSADEDEVTEEQQNYVRAVQQYLKIYNPQTEIDLEAVENIEDISAQKAVLQAALEFFRLGTHPEELTEEQEDFLDCFQVNRRTRREIEGYIDAIVEAVGIQGLSEKYGFVANQPWEDSEKVYCSSSCRESSLASRIVGFIEGLGMTGYSDAFAEYLITECGVKELADLFKLSSESLEDCGVIGKKFPDVLREALRNTADYKIIGAMGIPDIGPARAKMILGAIGGWNVFADEMIEAKWRKSFQSGAMLLRSKTKAYYSKDALAAIVDDKSLGRLVKVLRPFVENITEKFDLPRLGHTGIMPSEIVKIACKLYDIEITDGKSFDMLITGSLESNSDKMKLARKKGLPVYTKETFLKQYSI